MECDCGYVCEGIGPDELIDDARRHAREAHGIDVTADQVREVADFSIGNSGSG
jgi:predicted small metal-binding protein